MSMTDNKQSGLALVVVLWVVASLALLVAAFNASVKSSVVLVASETSLAQEHVLINAGVDLAVAQLTLASKEFRWQADGTAHEINFTGKRLRIKISEANGRIDLNKSDGALLLALLMRHASTALQAEEIRDRILDWRDDDQKRRDKGAEDPDYQRAGRVYGAGDTKFNNVTQLRGVLGVNYDLYRKLLPSITVHNRTGLINPLSASRDVLLSLPNVSDAEVNQVLTLREQGLDNKSSLLVLLAKSRKWLNTSSGPAYVISVEVEVKDGKYGLPAEITILKGGDNQAPYRVLDWRI